MAQNHTISAGVPHSTPGALRGLLVGCGHISTAHLETWDKMPDVSIVALVDTDENRARAQATRFGIEDTFSGLVTALSRTDADFVDVATPPDTHLDLTRICAKAGVHILCQKPLAPTLREVDEMIQIAGSAGVHLVANENMRFQPWYRKMKALLDEGRIGRPFYARIDARSRATLPTANFGEQPYFASMPRLVIYEMATHFFDTMRFLFGEPETLTAALGTASEEIAGEDHATVMMQYADLIALVDVSWASVPTYQTESSVGWAIATVEGRLGTMQLSMDGKLRVITDRGTETIEFGGEAVTAGFENMQRHFIACLTKGIECETSGREYAKTMELVFASYISASDRRTYRVGDDRGALL